MLFVLHALYLVANANYALTPQKHIRNFPLERYLERLCNSAE